MISRQLMGIASSGVRSPSGRPWLEWTSSHQRTSLGWGRSSCFGDEPKTHPLPRPRDFSAPFSAPTFSPPTFPPPPTSLSSFLIHSISRAWESSRAWVAQGFEEMWDTRLEEGGELNVEGMWRGESKRSISSQMQKQEKKGKLPPFSQYFFFSMVFFFFMFFFLLLYLRKKKMPRKKRLKRKAKNRRPKMRGQSESLKVSSLSSL